LAVACACATYRLLRQGSVIIGGIIYYERDHYTTRAKLKDGQKKTLLYGKVSWAHFLTDSYDEFLLIGLKKQHDKIHNSSLNTTHSARNLGFIFLTFSDQISAISKACYYHIRQLRCIRPPQRAPLPPPSFTPNLITVILSTTTYRSLRLPASN